MKILSSKAIKEVDNKTIKNNEMLSQDLMENAAMEFFLHFINRDYCDTSRKISIAIFSGVGNNGGDGAAVARLLHNSIFQVKLFVVQVSDNFSSDCSYNIDRAKNVGVNVEIITSVDEIPNLQNVDIVIDAIFGTGLSRPVIGLQKEVIETINSAQKTTISIDVPSGLFMDKQTDFAINATETVTFEIPKLSLFLPQNNQFVGDLSMIDIGLDQKAIAEMDTDKYFLTFNDLKNKLMPVARFVHKGTQGHTLIIGGSLGKIGSIVLSSKAALKSGCGLVTAYTPQCGVNILQSSFAEAMVVQDEGSAHISNICYDIKPSAIAIGMGMGQHVETGKALYHFLQKNRSVPMVIDADALNILSTNKEWMQNLTPNTILTPHPGELERLIGPWSDDFEKINLTQKLARKYNVIVVIKGAYTLIIDSSNLYVNSSGSEALATAGSGDVLSGIIAGLLAQGYAPLDAAQLGVYVHGLTTHESVSTINPRSFVATDIIENISSVYNLFEDIGSEE